MSEIRITKMTNALTQNFGFFFKIYCQILALAKVFFENSILDSSKSFVDVFLYFLIFFFVVKQTRGSSFAP